MPSVGCVHFERMPIEKKLTEWERSNLLTQNNVEQNGILHNLKTDKDTYKVGKEVAISLEITNNTDAIIDMAFCESPETDLRISKNGKIIYTEIHMYIYLREFKIAPRKTKIFRKTWNQKEYNRGTQVQPGEYKIIISLSANKEEYKVPVSKNINIVE